MTDLFVNGKKVEPGTKKKALENMSRAELDKLIDKKREEAKNVQPDQEADD
jgi:hypothetical protein